MFDLLGRGLLDVPTDEGGDVAGAQRPELELDGSMPVEQALTRAGQRLRHRSRPVRQDDADPLVVRRPCEVVQQAKAGVVGIVDVVDGQQQPTGGRCPADQFGCGHVQPLVRACAGP